MPHAHDTRVMLLLRPITARSRCRMHRDPGWQLATNRERAERTCGRPRRAPHVAQGARAHVVSRPAARCGETHLRMRRGAAETRSHRSRRVRLSFSITRSSCAIHIMRVWHVWSHAEDNVRSFVHGHRAVRCGRFREIAVGENAITDHPSLQNSAVLS